MKKSIWIILVVTASILVVGAVLIKLKTSTEIEDTIAKERPAISVRTVQARSGDLQAWIFVEGTARSVRREYLSFQNPGKVVYIKHGPGGGDLREGDRVSVGDVLARQDQRQGEASLTTARAGVREAVTGLAVAMADLDQAKTQETLAQATFERFDALIGQSSASQQEFDEAKAEAANARATVARAES